MPTARNRVFEPFDPNKSDPEDEDYDASVSRGKPNRAIKSRKNKSMRKRKRTARNDSASEDVSESEPSSDESFEEQQDIESSEVDPRTGRPIRKVSKNRPRYQESDEESDDLMNEGDSSDSDGRPAKKKIKTSTKKSLIVKLKATLPPSNHQRRKTKASSGHSASKHVPASPQLGITRRSSRIAQDDTEGLFALTNSGNHIEITRPPTKSPETFPARPTRGSKGIKKPPSAILEGTESSLQTKEEPSEDERPQEPEMEVAASGEEAEETVEAEENADSVNNNHNTVDQTAARNQNHESILMDESAIVPESNDEDDDIAVKPRRSNRNRIEDDGVEGQSDAEQLEYEETGNDRTLRRKLRSAAAHHRGGTRSEQQRSRKRGIEDTSDFEPGPEDGAEDDVSSSSESVTSPQKGSQERDDSSTNAAQRPKRIRTSARNPASAEHDSEEADELLEELEELRHGRPRRSAKAVVGSLADSRPQTRKRKPVDYRILPPDLNINIEEDGAPPAATPSRRGRGGGGTTWQRSLFSIEGPFGGAGGPPPVLGGGGPGGIGATGGVDSDSSDDDTILRQRPPGGGVGGTVGMTPTTAAPPGFGAFPAAAQTHNTEALQSSLGKIKDKQALADSDPLGVDPNVNFDGVGGLDGHIDQLKEMVTLPLLYPEIFQRFRVTPPRGVLFHGPPGTGKTLLARALASSVSSSGKKVTFYMRKGADALSKWVGEAERQLRLLFDEARKNQPSIIFFDEIDGECSN